VLGYEPYEEREIGRYIEEARMAARKHGTVLVIGSARAAEGRIYNSALVIDSDGSIAGYADKHFLWHFDRQWFTPGESIAPVQTAIGKLGALVCADGRIPTIARTLVDRGAEVLIMPTAWVTSGRNPENLENAQADLLARVRARENGVPFVAANKCGVELGCVAYCGKSQIVDARGTVVALASQDREEILVREIEVGEPRPNRAAVATVTWQPEPALQPLRIALTHRAWRHNDADLLRILEADVLLYEDDLLVQGEPYVPLAAVTDEQVLDPGALAEHRLAGRARLVTWRTGYEPEWQQLFARARALELRIYVAVFDTARNRAYAVDPDGAIVCGTYADYEIASFMFDPAKTQQTAVAPNTDVLEGLRRAQTHALD
jgi:predicted amidohydrolase